MAKHNSWVDLADLRPMFEITRLFHCRMSNQFSELCETMLTIIFLGCLTTLCAAMLLTQIEIVKHFVIIALACAFEISNCVIFALLLLVARSNWDNCPVGSCVLLCCCAWYVVIHMWTWPGAYRSTLFDWTFQTILPFNSIPFRDWAICLKKSKTRSSNWIGIHSQVNYNICYWMSYKVLKNHLLLNALEMSHAPENNSRKWVSAAACHIFCGRPFTKGN